jgi:hypothetical protein
MAKTVMDSQMKTDIDNMSYQKMLQLQRFGKSTEPFFQEGVYDYFKKVMLDKKAEIGAAKHTLISKRIGWDE